MTQIAIADIVMDGGTQVRARLCSETVAEFAEAMSRGDVFPPITVFYDGNGHYYLADGFHRLMAVRHLGRSKIAAVVKPGSKSVALWFALGALGQSGKQGLRPTDADKRHAVLLALQTWPEKSGRDMAEQIGVHQTYVSRLREEAKTSLHLPARIVGKDGKNYPASRGKPRPAPAGPRKRDRSPAAVKERLERIRAMAAEGHNVSQIAQAVGLSRGTVQDIVSREDIDVPASRAMGKSHRHNATRIVERIVVDVGNLSADVALVEFATLDRSRIPAWVASLKASRDALNQFIRRLINKENKHGEAA